jgi:ubiquinone/menaquinone biosynthesis C-methylase UbiE
MTLPAYAMKTSSFPDDYERFLVGPLFRPWAEILLDHARLKSAERVLDVACGTGIVARLAKERLGGHSHVVGIDVSPQMLAVARAVAPTIDWREGTAQAIPLLEGERFDVVMCHQGLQFFPDRGAALHEMRRATEHGGRLVVGVWKSMDETPLMHELHAVAERRLAPIIDRRHTFGDPLALERAIAESGFTEIRVEGMTQTIRFSEATVFVRLNTMALVGMSQASSTMNDEQRQQIVDAIVNDSADVVRQYTDAHGLVFELGANVATAQA